jgi:toxin HigB-1
MIRSFAAAGTRDVFDGTDSKPARRTCPAAIWPTARRKLDQLNQALRLDDLRAPPHNHLERLKGDRLGQHSIRINDQYRVCFTWTATGPENVEIVDYHS